MVNHVLSVVIGRSLGASCLKKLWFLIKSRKTAFLRQKNAKNARETGFRQVKKWSKNVVVLPKIDVFRYILIALVKVRHVCFYPSDTQKVDFLIPSWHTVKVCHVYAEGLLGRLKDRHKNFCRPSNDVGRLSFVTFSVRKSIFMSKSPSQSSGKVEKTEKMQKITFLALFYVYKFITSGRKGFWKASKSVKTCL